MSDPTTRREAHSTLLNAGRIEQADRVIRTVQPEDMHLNALYLEKSGRPQEAITLYERAGSSADANRVRTDIVRARFESFQRRGGIASSSIYRLSSDQRRLVRVARRAVPCPSCGAEVGAQCMGSGGSPNSDSHVQRRRLVGSLSFQRIVASPDVFDAAVALSSSRGERLSTPDSWRREREARRTVPCPRCGSEAGRQCVTPSGSPYSDSHVERRRAAGMTGNTTMSAGSGRRR